MLVRIKTYGVTVAITLVCVLIISQTTYAQPYACLPTCPSDARFFAFVGPGQSSFIDTNYVFGISSPDGSPTVELGVFDGDDATSGMEIAPDVFISDWDQGGVAVLRVTLYADPTGEGAQIQELAQWSSDGSFGNNVGNPMINNDWFNIMFTNTEDARSESGSFIYTLVIDSTNIIDGAQNQFKIRTDGSMKILPFQPFAFLSIPITGDDQFHVWPNLVPEDINNPACVDQITFAFVCTMQDPGCCIAGGPYDGTWKYYIEVPEGEGVFNVWDGDFDFGSASLNQNGACIVPDGVDVDTDDWNTPPGIPGFAIGTDSVPQGMSTPTNPPDNQGCDNAFLFDPSVIYSITNPLGDSYTNENPSGTQEWELYNIGSIGLVDVEVPGEQPGGIWVMMAMGTDFGNLNGLRFDHPVLAVNEMGEPVPFNPEEEGPRVVPTLNEWGMLGFVIFALITSVFFLRNRRFKHADK